MMKAHLILPILTACLLSTIPAAGQTTETLRYGDEQADGKKSLGGSGELIQFTAGGDGGSVVGIRIHGSRYGLPEAPNESFLVYLLSEDLSEVLHTETAPYSLFERGPEGWVDVVFGKARPVPQTFWVALDFRAHRTKGVYVSYDTSSGGQHSKVGLPGLQAAAVDFAGDWMIQVLLGK